MISFSEMSSMLQGAMLPKSIGNNPMLIDTCSADELTYIGAGKDASNLKNDVRMIMRDMKTAVKQSEVDYGKESGAKQADKR